MVESSEKQKNNKKKHADNKKKSFENFSHVSAIFTIN